MKIAIVSTLLLLLAVLISQAGEANWVGNYTDKKFLNGTAVFQLNILQEGNQISVDFDAVYSNGQGCAPQANGPAKIVDKNTLNFTFTDTSNNSGTGTIKRIPEGVIISVKPTRVVDPRCVVFYRD